MSKYISSKTIALTFGVLVICFAVGFYAVAWEEPKLTPPDGNVDAPLNVGLDSQAKEGNLSISRLIGGLWEGLLSADKLSIKGGAIINTGGAETGLIIEQGEVKFGSATIFGGESLPACDSSYRGKIYLLQSPSGIEDGLYICKKKSNDAYEWFALAGSPKWVSVVPIYSRFDACQEACKVSWETGGSRSCCCLSTPSEAYNGNVNVGVNSNGTRTITVSGTVSACETGDDQSGGGCGVECEIGNWHTGAFSQTATAILW